MFSKQEEWLLNHLKTEIPEHSPGPPQMDQQSLKEKVEQSPIIRCWDSTNLKPQPGSHQPLHKQFRKGNLRLIPFLGLRSKGEQRYFGIPSLHSHVEAESHTAVSSPAWKQEVDLWRLVISIKRKDYHLLADVYNIRTFVTSNLCKNSAEIIHENVSSFQYRAQQTSTLLKPATLQSPCMPTFLFIPNSESY